jgi:hypothetical protein
MAWASLDAEKAQQELDGWISEMVKDSAKKTRRSIEKRGDEVQKKK